MAPNTFEALPSPPCRFCGVPVSRTVVDLGMSPPCESFLTAEQLNHAEAFSPLHVRVCDACHLVQLEEYVAADEIFGGEYAYFSSYSTSWVEHARRYAEARVPELGLDADTAAAVRPLAEKLEAEGDLDTRAALIREIFDHFDPDTVLAGHQTAMGHPQPGGGHVDGLRQTVCQR